MECERESFSFELSVGKFFAFFMMSNYITHWGNRYWRIDLQLGQQEGRQAAFMALSGGLLCIT